MTSERDRSRPVAWTAVIATLMTASSLWGLLDPATYAHETRNWELLAQGQDLGNLLAAVTLVLACRAYVRGSRAAGSVWLGTLFYVAYAFAIYAVAVHVNRLFLVYVAVLGLSTYAAVRHLDELRGSAAPAHRGRRSAGYVLIGTGTLFALLWLSEILPALVTGEPPASLVEAGLVSNPVHVLDLAVVLPAFVLTGVSVLRGRPDGGFLAGPWLVFSVAHGRQHRGGARPVGRRRRQRHLAADGHGVRGRAREPGRGVPTPGRARPGTWVPSTAGPRTRATRDSRH